MKPLRKVQVAGWSIALLLLVTLITIANINTAEKPSDNERAKYIFMFIGDGMGATHVAAAESYLSYQAGLKGGEQLTFTKFPVLGMCTTYSADRNITCSSASGTAFSCGKKTNNGWLGISPEGDTLKSIASLLQDKGYQIGIMSSVPVNHATPGAFYGHSTDRYDYYSISEELAESGYEFFGGSGFADIRGKDGKKESSAEIAERNGYTVCYGRNEYEAAKEKAGKIVLCQEYCRDADAPTSGTRRHLEEDLSAGEMMTDCLEFLDEKKPFFIMYEGGDIDWAAHQNKIMPMVDNIIRFDEAVRKAVEFYKAHPDETLIILTADHETGGLTLGAGKGKGDIDWETLDSIWNASGQDNQMSKEENREMNEDAHIGWTTSGHTGGPVPVYALGKGAERFGGRFDNTDIPVKILAE